MSDLVQQTQALRRELAGLAADPEWSLLCRHDLLRNKPPEGAGERAWRRVKAGLARAGWMPPHVSAYAWVPRVKHGPAAEDADALVIWAFGATREEVRAACGAFQAHFASHAVLAPVLVTDVADFAFYSRLGWLVEFMPALHGNGRAYLERKRRHLAWRYRAAQHVPLALAHAPDEVWRALVSLPAGAARAVPA